MTEFDIIRRFFGSPPVRRADVVLGIGDDAAVLRPPAGQELALTTDTLVEGRHFTADAEAGSLGHKALAVNLSDLAAMGAEPAWFLLSLTLPEADEAWLNAFARGLHALSARFNIQLVGGNTTRGPLSIGVTAAGFVPAGAALTRRGAAPGDRIYVTGTLGDAALAVWIEQGRRPSYMAEHERVAARLNRPEPRIAAGIALRGLATAVIDVSDGLAADLGHVLEASGVGARVQLARLPLSETYRELQARRDIGWEPALAGGDDYELCFTVPAAREAELKRRAAGTGCSITAIGEIESGSGVRLVAPDGSDYPLSRAGYDHFAGDRAS
jgi:thiamine-monophosphate kinase